MKTVLFSFLLLLPFGALAAEQRIEERRAVAPDARIELSNVRGSIEVEVWSRDEVEVSGTLGDGVKGLIVEGDERRLSIRVDYPRGGNRGGWFGWWGGDAAGDSDLKVRLPAGVSLRVDSVSASIRVAGVAGSEITVKSVSGAVRLEADPAVLEVATVSGAQRLRSAAREIQVETVSGRIEVSGQSPDSLRAESVSGDLDLQMSGGVGTVTAETVSGSIHVGLGAALGKRASIESLSGGVELRLPRSSSARLRAESFSGSIDSDAGEVERQRYGPGSSLRHVLGNGDADVSIESFSGAIRIRLG